MNSSNIDTLAEALSVYWRTLKKTWPALVAVFLPVNAILVLFPSEIAKHFDAGDGIPVRATQLEQTPTLILSFFGLLAAAIAVRAAWRTLAKPTDETELHGGTVAAWGRAIATKLMITILVIAYALGALFGGLILLAPISRVLGSASQAFALPLVILLFLGIAAGGIALFARWILAVPMSMLFDFSGTSATKASARILKDRVPNCIGFCALAVLVAGAFWAIPILVVNCDVIGFAHPFTEFGTSGQFAAGIVMACFGALRDMATMFLIVALTVYLRRACEPAERTVPSRRRLVTALCIAGAVAIALFTTELLAKAVREPNELDDLRVFREENVELLPEGRVFDRMIGGAALAQEKRSVLNILNRARIFWFEVPFCSHCGQHYALYLDNPLCSSHDCDLFVWKPQSRRGTMRDGVTFSYHPSLFKLLPRDARRETTPEERERIRRELKRDKPQSGK